MVTKEYCMEFRKSLIAVLCAASLGTIAVPMAATADVGIYFNSAPPAARYEAIPAPRNGYVWSSGYWNANGNRHVWKAGHWERQRTGYHWAQPTWTQRDTRWQLERGRWNKGDRDGDGVPNAVDRAPDNPVRR
jgi:hypothetical protein